jgi:hypothetical protein
MYIGTVEVLDLLNAVTTRCLCAFENDSFWIDRDEAIFLTFWVLLRLIVVGLQWSDRDEVILLTFWVLLRLIVVGL